MGKAVVTSYWNRFSFRIKNQLYLRILPVVAVSVLSVGAFSGRLLTSRAERTYVEQESLGLGFACDGALTRIGVLALAAEVRKEDEFASQIATAAPGTHSQIVARFLQSFANVAGVRGAAFVEVLPRGAPGRVSIGLAKQLDTPANRDGLREWAQRGWSGYGGMDWVDLLAGKSWPNGPRILPADESHVLWLFEPIALSLADVDEDEPAAVASTSRQGGLEMVLPVAMHEELLWQRGDAAKRHPGSGRMHLVLLLDVQHLLSDWLREPGMRAVIDGTGRVLAANADTLEVGLNLTAADQHVFRRVEGAEVAALLRDPAPQGIAHANIGSSLNPYVFVLARRSQLPLVLLSTLELSAVNGGLVLYTAIIVLMVTIALLGSILAITSVGERLSNRLGAMAHNMEEVAKGDFSRRMGVGAEDEVGRLISYFNQMTADLAEAHHQLHEKTQNLRLALDKMQRLDRAKDDFLSLISHEVRTPLTSIIGGIDFLRVTLPEEGTQERRLLDAMGMLEIVEIIESSGRRLSEFMNDAIQMASLQSTDIRFQLKPVNLADMCEMVLSSLQEGIAAKSLRVDNELSVDADWAVLCDHELLMVALSKLLRNAVQHNCDHGLIRIAEVTEIGRLGPASEAVEEHLRAQYLSQPAVAGWRQAGLTWRGIVIHNTGPYIPMERREALFQKFELVGRIEHHQKGSGLSLPIVQAILENHSGKIHVESSREDGNSFFLILPTVPATAMPPASLPLASDFLAALGASSDAGKAAASGISGDEEGHGLGSTAGHEELDVTGNAAPLEVELQDLRT